MQIVQDALTNASLPPERLDLEITETALLDDKVKGIQILNRLRALGVTISLGDFETGFSALSHLQDFVLDRLKTDRSFIGSAESDLRSAGIIQAIGNLGAVLGFGVTAEGLETASQLEFVGRRGCDVVQGYLGVAPVRADQLNSLIARLPELGSGNAPDEFGDREEPQVDRFSAPLPDDCGRGDESIGSRHASGRHGPPIGGRCARNDERPAMARRSAK